MENLIPDILHLHSQSAGAQTCPAEDAGRGGGVPPASRPQQPRDRAAASGCFPALAPLA